MPRENPYPHYYLDIPLTEGVILRRQGFVPYTNVPWRIRHHSPAGLEWGYSGSGPADLALNILQAVLLHMHWMGPLGEPRWDGNKAFRLADLLYQDFKRVFLASMPQEGGVIPLETVIVWIGEHTLKPRFEKEEEE